MRSNRLGEWIVVMGSALGACCLAACEVSSGDAAETEMAASGEPGATGTGGNASDGMAGGSAGAADPGASSGGSGAGQTGADGASQSGGAAGETMAGSDDAASDDSANATDDAASDDAANDDSASDDSASPGGEQSMSDDSAGDDPSAEEPTDEDDAPGGGFGGFGGFGGASGPDEMDDAGEEEPSDEPAGGDEPSEGTPGDPVVLPGEDCVPDYGCTPEAPNTGDPYADCVTRINQFRACACLGPLERNVDAEACLDQQAEYDSTRGAHAGFQDNICEPRGGAQNECPGWRSIEQTIDGCIQMMYDEGPPPEDPCEGQCYQAHGHFLNMTDTGFGSVACGFYETADGEVWQVHNFYR